MKTKFLLFAFLIFSLCNVQLTSYWKNPCSSTKTRFTQSAQTASIIPNLTECIAKETNPFYQHPTLTSKI
ncbi:MAG: hypothetical protein JST62_02740 [Bacteroidetes bacterium]|nr:hypothetical protein [Bacteroidota bacterium]